MPEDLSRTTRDNVFASSGIGISTENSNGRRRPRELWVTYPQCNSSGSRLDSVLWTLFPLAELMVLSGDTYSRLFINRFAIKKT